MTLNKEPKALADALRNGLFDLDRELRTHPSCAIASSRNACTENCMTG